MLFSRDATAHFVDRETPPFRPDSSYPHPRSPLPPPTYLLPPALLLSPQAPSPPTFHPPLASSKSRQDLPF
eukprot:3827705-Pleurochrysis_carterae.AAC.1